MIVWCGPRLRHGRRFSLWVSEGLPYLAGEGLLGERLVDDEHPDAEFLAHWQGRLGIARHEKYLQIGPLPPCFLGEVDSVKPAGQEDIREQQIAYRRCSDFNLNFMSEKTKPFMELSDTTSGSDRSRRSFAVLIFRTCTSFREISN